MFSLFFIRNQFSLLIAHIIQRIVHQEKQFPLQIKLESAILTNAEYTILTLN